MGSNGSLTFTAIPVGLMALVSLTKAPRLGGGLRKTAELKGTGVAADGSENGSYSGSVAGILEAPYVLGAEKPKAHAKRTQFGLGLRLVNESFTQGPSTIHGNMGHGRIGLKPLDRR